MTLTQARKTLESRLPDFDGELAEAMALAISTLPRESTRPSARERFDYICRAIESAKDGMHPFADRSRNKELVCWRQCVWRQLKQEGYPNHAISKATGWDHATIWWGLERLTGYLLSGDPLAVATWQELTQILNK